jgi:hypothetical protein
MLKLISVETALIVSLLAIILLGSAQIAGAATHTFIPLLSG